MTPAARIAGVIELLDKVLDARVPMDKCAGDWFRNRKYIGSKDRSEIAERLYRIMRHKARYEWWRAHLGLLDTPRALVLIDCAFHDENAEKRLFEGGGQYAPDPLDEKERNAMLALQDQRLHHTDMPESVRLEIPDWAYDSLKARFGDDLEQEMLAMQEGAHLDLRVNTVLADSIEGIQKSLAKDGVETERTKYSPVGLRVQGKAYLAKTKAFSKGWVEIQDEGSQLIALLCGAKPGMRVLDYCAGGGGKTLAIAAEMKGKGNITAMDIDLRRLERGKKRYAKAGIHNVELRGINEDKGKKWLKRQKGAMDVVLVDAPCSSSGTWRRNPDLRWRFYGPSLDEIKALQAEILEKVADLVKSGGRLVYATCSLFREENEAQIETFLATHPEYKIVPIDSAWSHDTPPPAQGKYMALTPHQNGTDGFFTCILEKA